MSPEYNCPEQKLRQKSIERQVFRLLVKEDFRCFIRNTEYCQDYYIDSDTYTQIPESVGCFYRDAHWVVYETDERSNPVLEIHFITSPEAFQNAASRRKLVYSLSDTLSCLSHEPVDILALQEERQLVKNALKTLSTIQELLVLTDHPESISQDIEILQSALSKDTEKLQVIQATDIKHELDYFAGPHYCDSLNPIVREALRIAYHERCVACGMYLTRRDMMVERIINYEELKYHPELSDYIKALKYSGIDLGNLDFIENYMPVCTSCSRAFNRRQTTESLYYRQKYAIERTPVVLRCMGKLGDIAAAPSFGDMS